MPRSFSGAIQSEVALRDVLRLFTEPAIWIAPPNSSSFSVSVVLPASGWLTMAKVRRRRVSWRCEGMEAGRLEREPAIVAWNGDGLDKNPAAAPVEAHRHLRGCTSSVRSGVELNASAWPDIVHRRISPASTHNAMLSRHPHGREVPSSP